ncbi:mitochondrial import receptor subunit TOM20-like protein [Leptotrombidium deliense]|uniref:Mitochondrial import receptor subunit TOM20-like protein n=1 Tax=Leptotrombidium deliense TaxID=299467 RepID=A0A443SHR3_9ACAR|nr:mitochondrial import receptor subunit TOM20-like protein [Leptotrombidium deliense]
MLTDNKWQIAAGVCGGLFLAYCVYFDRKRRSDPEFKQKLREKRKAAKKLRESGSGATPLPDMRDFEAVQRFFIQEVQKGEELLGMGDVENGVEHLSNAVAVCVQPQQLLQVLQQTLPPQIFQLLLARLPVVSQRIANSAAESRSSKEMVEDDVE